MSMWYPFILRNTYKESVRDNGRDYKQIVGGCIDRDREFHNLICVRSAREVAVIDKGLLCKLHYSTDEGRTHSEREYNKGKERNISQQLFAVEALDEQEKALNTKGGDGAVRQARQERPLKPLVLRGDGEGIFVGGPGRVRHGHQ